MGAGLAALNPDSRKAGRRHAGADRRHGICPCLAEFKKGGSRKGAAFFMLRHPELVSGSIARPATVWCVSGWMLKRVQHDGAGSGSIRGLKLGPDRVERFIDVKHTSGV